MFHLFFLWHGLSVWGSKDNCKSSFSLCMVLVLRIRHRSSSLVWFCHRYDDITGFSVLPSLLHPEVRYLKSQEPDSRLKLFFSLLKMCCFVLMGLSVCGVCTTSCGLVPMVRSFIKPSGARVPGVCKQLCGHWELNQSPLQ